jgi:hypothetical protein
MKKFFLSLCSVCCLLFAFFLSSCGNGPGSPGSQGTEDTGVAISATISFASNATADIQSFDVDAFQEVCSSGDPEPFHDHTAQVTFNATLLNPDTTFTPGTLYVENYTITYTRKNDSLGAPPIEQYVGTPIGGPIAIVPPAGTGISTVTATVMFVDLTRKDKYANDMLTGTYSSSLSFINNYIATYTFTGHNSFGESFTVKIPGTDFEIGDFDNC